MDQTLNTLTDEQLCAQCQDSQLALELLVQRYQQFVKSYARRFYLTGAELDDLLQEGMVGLLHAVLRFDPRQDVTFKTFAAVCVKNRLVSAMRSELAQKNRALNNSIPLCTFSLDSLSDEMHLAPTEQSPEELLIGRETFLEFQTWLAQVLSPLEKCVLELYLMGLSYGTIADTLQKTTKSVDNAIQRIRQKSARMQYPA